MLGQVSPGGRGNVSTCNICRKWVLFDPILPEFCRALRTFFFKKKKANWPEYEGYGNNGCLGVSFKNRVISSFALFP